jgi:hypothetical protein
MGAIMDYFVDFENFLNGFSDELCLTIIREYETSLIVGNIPDDSVLRATTQEWITMRKSTGIGFILILSDIANACYRRFALRYFKEHSIHIIDQPIQGIENVT